MLLVFVSFLQHVACALAAHASLAVSRKTNNTKMKGGRRALDVCRHSRTRGTEPATTAVSVQLLTTHVKPVSGQSRTCARKLLQANTSTPGGRPAVPPDAHLDTRHIPSHDSNGADACAAAPTSCIKTHHTLNTQKNMSAYSPPPK